MEPSISAQSPFTFEIATRINSAWEGATNGSVLNLFPGTPRSSTAFYIGTNTVCDHNYTVVHTGDNTDKMHVFRITYKGEWPNRYTIFWLGGSPFMKKRCMRRGNLPCRANTLTR